MSSNRAVGIDLGTTCSAIARADEMGRSVMVRNPQGDLLIPSIVYFEDEELVFGRAAKQSAVTQPGRAAELVLRDLGQPAYSRAIGGELLPTELIEGCLLKRLCADLATPEVPRPAVVLSVPSSFNQTQRKAILDSGLIAGIDVLGTINSPLAAGLAFAESHGYLNRTEDKPGCRVLVFDLGGGKLDVAIVEVKPDRLRTMAIGGDGHLGGRDWDARLADHLAELFAKQFGEDPRYDMTSVRRLLERAEEAKQTLSTRQQARVRVERASNAADITLSRQTLEELTADLVERARSITQGVLNQAGMAWRDLAHVLLIGGATRMPIIPKMLEKLGGLQPAANVHPEEAIARGTALHAAQLLALREKRKPQVPVQLTELTSHSLGVEWTDPANERRENVVIIPRGTELPCATISKVSTTADDQRSISVQLLEGESRVAEQCIPVAQIVLRDLPPGLPRQAAIDMHYQFTVDGKLQVKAQMPDTDQPVTIEVHRSRGLTEGEVSDWKKLIATQDGLRPILTLVAHHQQQRAAARPVPQEADPEEHELEGTELDPMSVQANQEALARARGKHKFSSRKLAIMLAGHVLFATLGLAIGYYILMRIDPSYNWWHLRLPGLSPAATGSVPSAPH